MKINFRKEAQKIRRIQSKYIILQKEILSNIKNLDKELEKYILRRWKETFGNIKIEVGNLLECGCLSKNWETSVYIDLIDDMDFRGKHFYRFTWDETLDKPKYQKVSNPVPMKNLRQFLRQITEETGFYCYLSRRKEPNEDETIN